MDVAHGSWRTAIKLKQMQKVSANFIPRTNHGSKTMK